MWARADFVDVVRFMAGGLGGGLWMEVYGWRFMDTDIIIYGLW
jgi:hypothetical protein